MKTASFIAAAIKGKDGKTHDFFKSFYFKTGLSSNKKALHKNQLSREKAVGP